MITESFGLYNSKLLSHFKKKTEKMLNYSRMITATLRKQNITPIVWFITNIHQSNQCKKDSLNSQFSSLLIAKRGIAVPYRK